ncbi:hypothetical protein C9439_07015, partial [archaeon SCG-AAA382B04]
VKINYTGRLEDGAVFDTTSQEVAEEEGMGDQADFGPKTIILGAEHVVEGLEKAILDSEVGEDSSVEVDPEDGFGEYDEDQIEALPKREFKKKYDEEPRRGKRVNIEGQPGTIISTVGGRVRIDLNHPLAGEELEYEYEVLEKIEETSGKIKALIDLYGQQINSDQFEVEIEDKVADISVPKSATFSQGWMLSKRQIPQDVFEYTDLKKVRFVEEYESPEQLEEDLEQEESEEEIEEVEEEVEEEEEQEKED